MKCWHGAGDRKRSISSCLSQVLAEVWEEAGCSGGSQRRAALRASRAGAPSRDATPVSVAGPPAGDHRYGQVTASGGHCLLDGNVLTHPL